VDVGSDDLPLRSAFVLPGMDCPTEEQLVRMALADVAGVRSLEFDLGARRLEAVHVGPADTVLAALTPLGMGAALDTSTPVDGAATGASPPARVDERAALWAVLIINAAMFVIEAVAGLLSDSTGLLADSMDMLADASIYGIALLAVGRMHAGQRRAARASGWVQLALAGLVLVEVLRRATGGSEPLEGAMIGIGLLALAANVTCLALLSRHRRSGEHMRASWIFTTNDVLANVAVMVAGGLVWLTGSAVPDLVIGAGIALLVASGAWRILRVPISRGSAL
jgi:Co/Zn/Cd efflux system component